MTKCWQISGLPKMLLRGQRLDTFGWVICKCQSLAAIREQAGSNGCILTKARRALGRPAASKPPDPRPAAHRPGTHSGCRPAWGSEPRRPTQASKFLFDFIPPFPSRKQQTCQELAGCPPPSRRRKHPGAGGTRAGALVFSSVKGGYEASPRRVIRTEGGSCLPAPQSHRLGANMPLTPELDPALRTQQ